jgi:energy-coupling factor transporter ATP-binding protein EcfA2
MGNKFKVAKITKFSDLQEGVATEIPTSDLCLTSNEAIVQFEYVEDEEHPEKITIYPGVYTVNRGSNGLRLDKTELRHDNVLTTITNSKTILGEVDLFFNKLSIYDQLKLPKRRAILLFSDPGCGKSTAIRASIRALTDRDPGTVAIIWPTSDVRAEDFSKFLSFAVDYDKDCTNLILIMEDIGGNVEEGGGRPRDVNSGLLNMLDGVNLVFKLPTFMIATTNYPANLLSALSDRPGRFDQMIELAPPSYDEQIALMEFIAKRPLTADEGKAFKIKGAEKLSIAHLNEIIIRSLLHDKTFEQVVKEMIAHQSRVKKDFSKTGSMGIGNSWDD